jgi:hypothetical protein
MYLAGYEIDDGLARALIRDVQHVDVGLQFEELPRKCWTVPEAGDANCNCPGLTFASAMRSFTFLAASDGCTTSRFGAIATNEIGAKSFAGSYGSLISDGRIDIAAMCAIITL